MAFPADVQRDLSSFSWRKLGVTRRVIAGTGLPAPCGCLDQASKCKSPDRGANYEGERNYSVVPRPFQFVTNGKEESSGCFCAMLHAGREQIIRKECSG